MTYELVVKTACTGYVEDDGADTRTYTREWFLVPYDDRERFGELIADDYGSTDYSYQPNYTKLGDVAFSDLQMIVELMTKELERQKAEDKAIWDILNE